MKVNGADKIAVARPAKIRLYNKNGTPCTNFNHLIAGWLDGSVDVKEHSKPAAFESLRIAYCSALNKLIEEKGLSRWDANRTLLSNLTDLMFGVDITEEIGSRLTSEQINIKGFRSALAQGFAKNTGENFTNIIVYALADALSFQDEVVVDKGLSPILRKSMEMKKNFATPNGPNREITVKIEGDFCVFSRTNQENAIVISAKTRLKEIFHIAVMWKLFLDMLEDEYCRNKWGLQLANKGKTIFDESELRNILYVFATADMISKDGTKTQGCDVEREEVRNLIAMDAAFLDYVFVSKGKEKASHISSVLNLQTAREALFHELGCLLDLISQKFGLGV